MRLLLGTCVAAACAKIPAEPVARGAPVASSVHTTPRQLFADFTHPDADGLVLLDKYRDGATFTATIKTIGLAEDGSPVVWIEVDGDDVMTLDFAEPPPVGLVPGARLTVTCKIGGASGALMIVTDCVRGV